VRVAIFVAVVAAHLALLWLFTSWLFLLDRSPPGARSGRPLGHAPADRNNLRRHIRRFRRS
jgi:hypothetical protein